MRIPFLRDLCVRLLNIRKQRDLTMRKDEGLYRQQFEHDNCGIGAVVNSKGHHGQGIWNHSGCGDHKAA